jgi:hypothetical protein
MCIEAMPRILLISGENKPQMKPSIGTKLRSAIETEEDTASKTSKSKVAAESSLCLRRADQPLTMSFALARG